MVSVVRDALNMIEWTRQINSELFFGSPARDLEGRTPKKCPVRQKEKIGRAQIRNMPGTFFEVSAEVLRGGASFIQNQD